MSTSGILDSIDGALRDYEMSADAMRWLPEADREAPPPGPAAALDLESFAAALEDMGRMLARLWGDLGTAAGEAFGKLFPVLAVMARADAEWRERRDGGGKLAVDGHEYRRRLAARRRRGHGR